MLPLDYAVLRVVRKFAPGPIVRLALSEGWGIRPGLETRRPGAATARYIRALRDAGHTLQGAQVFVLGYGGSFGLGISLLQAGAAHVILQDPYAPMWDRINRELAENAEPYLHLDGRRVVPDPRWITVVKEQVIEYAKSADKVDIVLSSSVFEHIPNPAEVASAASRLTRPDGLNLHIIDLRDHYFKYPFEMLCHSERNWKRYLNPPVNLNRYRLADYRQVFSESFGMVECQILESDLSAFHQTKPRIRSEFISGDDTQDSSTKILVLANSPEATVRPPVAG